MAKVVADPFAKPFSWSYSRLKNFDTCPRRHYHCDLKRDIQEPESDALKWGNALHDAMANAIGTDDNHLRAPRERITQKPLPADMARYQPWVGKFLSARALGAKVYAEQSLAITRQFKACEWFAPEAWFRAKVDVLVVSPDGRVAAAYDWKTGKVVEDSPQLMMTSIAVMLHNPGIEAVRTEFVWLKDMKDGAPFECITRVAFRRSDIAQLWSGLAPRVKNLESAYAAQDYPARPGGLCRRWCPVHTCEHHGR